MRKHEAKNRSIDLTDILHKRKMSEYDWTFIATVNNRDEYISYHLIENGSERTASDVYMTYIWNWDTPDVLDILDSLHLVIMKKWKSSHKDGC